MVVTLRWPGTGTLQAARRAIRDGDPVEIELPLEVHHALQSRLPPPAVRGAAEQVDVSGGAELLARVAAVTGFVELKRLQAAARRARYGVRVTSPDPRLSLTPPER